MHTKQKRLNKGEDEDIYNILCVSILIIPNLDMSVVQTINWLSLINVIYSNLYRKISRKDDSSIPLLTLNMDLDAEQSIYTKY